MGHTSVYKFMILVRCIIVVSEQEALLCVRLFGMPLESNLINMGNQHILMPHLLCAAFESPLDKRRDRGLFGGEAYDTALKTLCDEGDERLGCLMAVGMPGGGNTASDPLTEERFSFCGDTKKGPSGDVSLRCIDQNRWKIKCPTGPGGSMVVMEEIEEWMAFYQIYVGAVYMNSGRTYVVDRVEEDVREGLCQPARKLDYYTSSRNKGEIRCVPIASHWLLGHRGCSLALKGCEAGMPGLVVAAH